eukprot:6025732-Amphidinium_carterae.1
MAHLATIRLSWVPWAWMFLEVSNFDATHALEMKLAAEQDHHLQEATNWNHQLALLTAEKDDLFVQHKAEVVCNLPP